MIAVVATTTPETGSQPRIATSDEIRAIDAAYKHIPAFSAWAPTDVSFRTWEAQRTELTGGRAAAEPSALDGAVKMAMRAAAADTGAIEGLYQHDRGFTMTVATVAAAREGQFGKQ